MRGNGDATSWHEHVLHDVKNITTCIATLESENIHCMHSVELLLGIIRCRRSCIMRTLRGANIRHCILSVVVAYRLEVLKALIQRVCVYHDDFQTEAMYLDACVIHVHKKLGILGEM